jgi:hypothetical protein
MPIKLNGATNGSVELDVPAAVGSDLQITLPATAGTAIVKAADGSVDLGSVDIDSSGNVGIGTLSPSVSLHVAATEPQFYIQDSNSTGNGVNATIQFRDSSNSQLSYLGFAGTSDSHLSLFNTMSGGALRFGTASSERMRIDSSGQILMNCTSQIGGGYIQHLKMNSGTGGIAIQNYGASNTAIVFRNSANNGSAGAIATSNTSTSYNTSSDYRLKENVVDIADGITRVKQLAPKRFNFIVDADTTVDGFLAHEAQTVVPEAVTGEKDGEEMQGIDQSKLVPLLTAALQEAIAKIETLEARVTTLEAG